MLDLPEDMTIAAALERMIRGHVHIALLRDKQHRVVGMVTLEDILEELVGDILDEYDRVPAHFIESGPGWVMGGGVSLERLEQLMGAKINREGLDGSVRNLSDLVRLRLDRPPRGGDVVHDSGLRILVRKVRRQQVLEAQISRDEGRFRQLDSSQARPPAEAPAYPPADPVR
jgi:putative hemolysin